VTLETLVKTIEDYADHHRLDPLEVLNELTEHYIPELLQLDFFVDYDIDEGTLH